MEEWDLTMYGDKKLSYRRGTARRTVSVKTVLNVAQMFTQFHVIGPSPTLGIRRSLAPQLLGPFNYPKDGENRRKTAKDTRRQAKDVLASFVNKRWAMKDDKKRRAPIKHSGAIVSRALCCCS